MNGKYGDIPNSVCYNFFTRLVDKLFKIIPLKESNSDTVNSYIKDLIYELLGYNSIFEMTDCNPKVLNIVCILESVKNEDMKHYEYRRNIFKCITIAKQLQNIVCEVNYNAKRVEDV